MKIPLPLLLVCLVVGLGLLSLVVMQPTNPLAHSIQSERLAPNATQHPIDASHVEVVIDRLAVAHGTVPRRGRIDGEVSCAVTGLPVYGLVSDGQVATWTDRATGCFQLSTLSRRLTVQADGFATRSIDLLETESPICVKVQPLATRRIIVRTSQGTAVPLAQVAALVPLKGCPARKEIPVGVTDRNGELTLQCSGPAHLLARSGAETVSHPLLSTEDTTIICDQSTSSGLRILDAAGHPTECAVLLTRLEGDFGLCIAHDHSATKNLAMPSGQWAITVPGRGPLRLLPDCSSFLGQLLTLPPNHTEVATLERTDQVNTLVLDAETGRKLDAEISLEALAAVGWESVSGIKTSGSAGVVSISPLLEFARLALPGHVRFRIEAVGYAPAYVAIDVLRLSGSVSLLPSQRLRVRFRRDDEPFAGMLLLRQAIGSGTSKTTLHEGEVPPEGVDVSFNGNGLLEVLSSRHAHAPLAVVEVRSVGPSGLDVSLPASGTVQLHLEADVPPDISLQRSDGVMMRGALASDDLTFAGLFPGSYRIGPTSHLACLARSNSILEVQVAAGAVVVAPWCTGWRAAVDGRGRLALPNSKAIPQSSLWVLPWQGAAPVGHPGVLMCAVPVGCDGTFAITPRQYCFDNLVVYTVMTGGVVTVVRELGTTMVADLDARPVMIQLRDSRPRPAVIHIPVPPDDQGRGGQMLNIPCQTTQSVSLGVIPRRICSGFLSAEGRTVKFELSDALATVVEVQ